MTLPTLSGASLADLTPLPSSFNVLSTLWSSFLALTLVGTPIPRLNELLIASFSHPIHRCPRWHPPRQVSMCTATRPIPAKAWEPSLIGQWPSAGLAWWSRP